MGENLGMTVDLEKLEHVEPRTVRVHEAHDFTPWLLENADRIPEALRIDLKLDATKHAVGCSVSEPERSDDCTYWFPRRRNASSHGARSRCAPVVMAHEWLIDQGDGQHVDDLRTQIGKDNASILIVLGPVLARPDRADGA
jgi:hypothetical protein